MSYSADTGHKAVCPVSQDKTRRAKRELAIDGWQDMGKEIKESVGNDSDVTVTAAATTTTAAALCKAARVANNRSLNMRQPAPTSAFLSQHLHLFLHKLRCFCAVYWYNSEIDASGTTHGCLLHHRPEFGSRCPYTAIPPSGTHVDV